MENTNIRRGPAPSGSGAAASTPHLPSSNVYQYNNGFGGVRYGFNSYGSRRANHFSGTISEDHFGRYPGMVTNSEGVYHQGYGSNFGQSPHLPPINENQNLAPRFGIPLRQNQISRRPSLSEDIRMTMPVFRQPSRASRPSLSEDIRMTTPESSRKQSQIMALLPHSPHQRPPPDGGICACQPGGGPLLPSPETVNLARDAMDAVPLYHTTPSNGLRINDLLNTNADANVESSSPATLQHRTPINNTQGPEGLENSGGIWPPHTHPSISLSLSSLSSASGESTITGTGIRPISEERFYLLNNLYHICVDASAMYIRSLQPVFSRSRFRSPRRRRYHPYRSHSRSPRTGANRRHQYRDGENENEDDVDMDRRISLTYNHGDGYHHRLPHHHLPHQSPPSLMDNISTISTHLWRTARADPLAPRRAEADAVTEMKDLYHWAEIVARGIHHDNHDDSLCDFSDTTLTSLSSSEMELEMDTGDWDFDGDFDGEGYKCKRIARAARKLCSWIGDGRATEMCREILGELRVLRELRGSEKIR